MQASTKWTIGIVTTGTLICNVILAMGWQTEPPLPHLWHKALHLTGMMFLMGNIIVTGFWMFMAERTGEPRVIAFAAKMVDWADVWFTAPGVVLLALNGLFMSNVYGGFTGTPWLLTAFVLFSIAGLFWVVFCIPLQNKMVTLSAAGAEGKPLPPEFFRAVHRWYFWGTLATITPFAALFVMVLK